jgi:hypothetical protein
MNMSRTNVLDRFLDPVGSFLTPEVARRLAGFRADAKTQARLDKLAEKCRDGRLSDKERGEYDTYLSAIDFITVLQAKARSVLKNEVKR